MLLNIFEVATVDRKVLEESFRTEFNDYEDAIIYSAAIQSGIACIVTRNVKDFEKASIPIYEPEQLLLKIHSLR